MFTPIQAQVPPTDGRSLEEIIVSASGIRHSPVTPLPASTSDSAGLLRFIPGVDLRSAGGVSSIPGIHDMSGDRVRTKLDGMDLISSCANHMNPPLSYIDPSNVDTVDVLADISSVSVGDDSICMMMAPNTFENINDGRRDRYGIFGEWEAAGPGMGRSIYTGLTVKF